MKGQYPWTDFRRVFSQLPTRSKAFKLYCKRSHAYASFLPITILVHLSFLFHQWKEATKGMLDTLTWKVQSHFIRVTNRLTTAFGMLHDIQIRMVTQMKLRHHLAVVNLNMRPHCTVTGRKWRTLSNGVLLLPDMYGSGLWIVCTFKSQARAYFKKIKSSMCTRGRHLLLSENSNFFESLDCFLTT